ncbi:DUF4097 family beta strand repeat-containing protein [Psychrobacillus vulpis]|nr:DUF4097 family beta strand repeat-containing protein [Psychrobacillus vulpis]
MSIKKIAIGCLFVLLAGAAISIILNIKDTFVDKADEILVEDNNYSNIEVLSENASVKVLPAKDGKTKVEFSGKIKKKSNYIFNADVNGDTLYVELKEKRWNFIQFGFTSRNIQLIVYVPEKEYQSLKTEIDNGKIKTESIHANEISLETDNGLIDMNNIVADNVQVKTDNGQIRMEEVEGAIHAKTDNGRIILTSNNLDRSINLKTDNGLIQIQTDKEPTNATIDAQVDNGKIEVFGTSNKQTIFGNGENLIKLETDNGKITVKKQ